MTTQFSQRRPPYNLPGWCTKGPAAPLPPGPYVPKLLNAMTYITWPNLAGTMQNSARFCPNIPETSLHHFTAEYPAPPDTLRVEITLNPTLHKLTAGITVYKAAIFQASITFLARPYPTDSYWVLTFEMPDAQIPAHAFGWIRIWP